MFKLHFIKKLFFKKSILDEETIDQIESALLTADVSATLTKQLLSTVTAQLKQQASNDPSLAFSILKKTICTLLKPVEIPLIVSGHQPFVILVIGVNGAGKTTTIAKLAQYYQRQNKRILLAAGDTFRAAAIAQLQMWGEKLHCPVIAQQPGSDAASVVFDAMSAAKARKSDLLIIDTAGRLHTQAHLLVELQKIKRILAKIDPTAPQEILIVLDAVFGQNAMNQVKQFQEKIGVTGIVLTKCDGTAKGGSLLSIVAQTPLPIRFIGTGEKQDDLSPFHAESFVDRLFEAD